MSRGKIYQAVEARARSRDPADFWGQVGRSVRGKSVDESQIAMLVEAVVSGLELNADDILLDLCCANGALSDRFFARCKGGIGVDFSDYLIDIATRNFAQPPLRSYVLADVGEYLRNATINAGFTKALCYGSFAVLPPALARDVLTILRQRFVSVRRVFVGNVPDKSRLHDFFDPSSYTPGIESDPSSAIGVWRSVEEFDQLAAATGWRSEVRRMPAAYYSAHYRFDVVLTPA